MYRVDLPVSSFVFSKSVDLVVAHDGFLTSSIFFIVATYFDYRGAFQAVLDSDWCVKG